VERFGTRTVRRVLRPRVARRIAGVLEEVVEDGSGTRARLATFRVAGKSGTSRAYDPAGGYRPGDYYASFAGFFPAEDPQLVIFVKLERPRNGAYYGGSVAAPVTRATMEAALAARSTPLDRFRLLRTTRERRPAPGAPVVRFASATVDPPPAPLEEAEADGVRPSSVALPDMTGLPARVAARRLHALGLRVTREGRGDITATLPAPGTRVLPGDTVRLRSPGGGGG
jgi:membrane peptidoglycan carboxypeptidase